MTKILVIGSGAWGSAIANLIAKNSFDVFLSTIEKDVVAEVNNKNTNETYLPGLKFLPNITATLGFEDVISQVDAVFIVTPSNSCNIVFSQISDLKSQGKVKDDCSFVICSKGFEPKSLTLLSDAFEEITKIKDYAVLSGPNFAVEVADFLPTITAIASQNEVLANKIIKILDNENFKGQYSSSPKTAEICSIVKNIIAIGCGITDGLNLGVNTKSALVMKGVEEIQILCKKFNVSQDLANAAGFGDIFLTCSSSKSRNNSLGSLLAKGQSYQKITKETGKTYEGASSADSVAKICKKLALNLPLCAVINDIINNEFSSKQIEEKIIKAIL